MIKHIHTLKISEPVLNLSGVTSRDGLRGLENVVPGDFGLLVSMYAIPNGEVTEQQIATLIRPLIDYVKVRGISHVFLRPIQLITFVNTYIEDALMAEGISVVCQNNKAHRVNGKIEYIRDGWWVSSHEDL